jgi:tetratricopeptide (TPR) repeat protein
MDKASIKGLARSAAQSIAKQRLAEALDCYLRLERVEPNKGAWPRRAADCYRRLGRRRDQLAALERAAKTYAKRGMHLRAIAMCRMILALDPDHAQTKARLAKLQKSRARGLDRFRRTPGAARAGDERASRLQK